MALACQPLAAQTDVLESLADANPGTVNYIYVSKPMLKSMMMLPEKIRDSDMLESVELLTVSNDSVASLVDDRLRDYTRNGGMELVSSVRSEDHSSDIYGRKRRDTFRELVLVKRGDEAPLSVVIIKGDLPPSDLEELFL